MNIQTIITTSLHFREGNSDKVYHVSIEPKDGGHVVTFAYGRRGQTLTAGTKTPAPVTLDQARAIHRKLVATKLAKGYRESAESPGAYQQPGDSDADTGIRCQLLSPVEESELARLLDDTRHCLQQKHDGRRLLILKRGNDITGINRRGLATAIPAPIQAAAAEIPHDFLIDGEAVGDTLHAFDLLELDGHDLRGRSFLHRSAGLLVLLDGDAPHLRPVVTTVDPAEKRAAFELHRQCRGEGVVFKDLEAPFSPGRPNSGGSQLKYKFVRSASFIVAGHNAKRSVALALLADGKEVAAGNVTIPPNHPVPAIGEIVEVRYLYAFRQSGHIYQPVYLGSRDDLTRADCGTGQLEYKPEPWLAAA